VSLAEALEKQFEGPWGKEVVDFFDDFLKGMAGSKK
jgi:hypothetical protein